LSQSKLRFTLSITKILQILLYLQYKNKIQTIKYFYILKIKLFFDIIFTCKLNKYIEHLINITINITLHKYKIFNLKIDETNIFFLFGICYFFNMNNNLKPQLFKMFKFNTIFLICNNYENYIHVSYNKEIKNSQNSTFM